MPYNVRFTDPQTAPITVYDNTSSTDTSLTFPGRNVTGYGQIIAENFLHLLENFASATQPVNPVEGQLWYDTSNSVLQLYDGHWRAASNIQKSPTQPAVESSNVGELWVDTTNQQLRIYTGTQWLLVGPQESSVDGLRYGPSVDRIDDTDNNARTILVFYIADIPIAIVSKDSFTPKVTIDGFKTIQAGVTLNVPANASQQAQFIGGLLPKLWGTASSADALNVSGSEVASSKFLRSDIDNTTEGKLKIANNGGITIGVNGTFELSTSSTSAKIYNKTSGSSLDLVVNREGVQTTVVRIIDNKVGINNNSPEYPLDVSGTASISGYLLVSDTTESTNLNNGSFRTAGGAAITKNLIVGTTLLVQGTSNTKNIIPSTTDTYELGSPDKRWNAVHAKSVIANEFIGTLNGTFSGNANTATALKNVTTFQLTGDVISPSIQFDGQVGSYTKVFTTSLTANIIKTKSEPAITSGDTRSRSLKDDYVLTYRPSAEIGTSSGLLKQNRDTFVGDLGVPIGSIFPYAGTRAPYGYLLCDGSEIEQAKYPDLFDTIGNTYSKNYVLAGSFTIGRTYTIETLGTTNFVSVGASTNTVGLSFIATGPGVGTGTASTTSFIGIGTFRLPDLRGRFPLGKDNMDNAFTVPTETGGFVDAGGGNIDRVPDTKADILGQGSGQSSTSLTLGNLPEHSHNMRNGTTEYAAIRVDTSINPPASTGLGPTAPGQAQYLKNSGGITKPDGFQLGQPIGIMNPYLTLNYIIRSGPPTFITTYNNA